MIRRCKRVVRDDNSALVWVMPYETAEYRDNVESFHDYYDDVEICGASAGGHFKGAYQTRNREMIDRSDLVVFCVEHETGGAYKTMCYAKKCSKCIVNLSNSSESIVLSCYR